MSETTTTAYAICRDVEGSHKDVVERVTAALADEGFGVLSTIDVAATLKKRLNLDMAPYVILGACNPSLASQGLAAEPDLGVLLPCNVVVREEAGVTRIAAMEPLAAMGLSGNAEIEPLAREARERIERAIRAV